MHITRSSVRASAALGVALLAALLVASSPSASGRPTQARPLLAGELARGQPLTDVENLVLPSRGGAKARSLGAGLGSGGSAREGGRRQLDCVLDAPFFGLLPNQEPCGGPLRHQLRAAAVLHGRATARLTAERRPGADELADLLRFAWQQTAVARLMVQRLDAPEHRLAFPV